MVKTQHIATSDPAHPRNSWATPWELFNELDQEFQFTLDACASAENAKCGRYLSLASDGLTFPWANERVFCNPPYGRGLIEPWVKKAHETTRDSSACALVVMLLPARVSTKWFHDYVYPVAAVRFLRGRVRFVPPESLDVKSSSPREDSMICIFRSRKL